MRRVTKENLITQIDRLYKIKDDQGQLSMNGEYNLQAYKMLLATMDSESSAVTVKLPKLKMLEDYLAEVAIEERKQILVGVKLEFHRALAAAGIKVEAE